MSVTNQNMFLSRPGKQRLFSFFVGTVLLGSSTLAMAASGTIYIQSTTSEPLQIRLQPLNPTQCTGVALSMPGNNYTPVPVKVDTGCTYAVSGEMKQFIHNLHEVCQAVPVGGKVEFNNRSGFNCKYPAGF